MAVPGSRPPQWMPAVAVVGSGAVPIPEASVPPEAGEIPVVVPAAGVVPPAGAELEPVRAATVAVGAADAGTSTKPSIRNAGHSFRGGLSVWGKEAYAQNVAFSPLDSKSQIG